jgi:hypothetical protein
MKVGDMSPQYFIDSPPQIYGTHSFKCSKKQNEGKQNKEASDRETSAD